MVGIMVNGILTCGQKAGQTVHSHHRCDECTSLRLQVGGNTGKNKPRRLYNACGSFSAHPAIRAMLTGWGHLRYGVPSEAKLYG